MTRYRTIVADPPWPYGTFNSFSSDGPSGTKGRLSDGPKGLGYPTLKVQVIQEIPVREWADDAAHLYLWTTTRHLRASFDVLEAWGFRYSTTLTWVKAPMGKGMGGAFHPSTEHVLFGVRGGLEPLKRWDCSHFTAKRPYDRAGKPIHSGKPDAFLDIVEQVSPGPRLEMFARRARFGWDYWGDESLGTAQMPGEAA